MLANQSETEQRAILESMAKIDADPLLQWRARQRIGVRAPRGTIGAVPGS